MKIKSLIVGIVALFAVSAHADTCAKNLTGPFVAQQAVKLCSTFTNSSAVNTDIYPSVTNTYNIGDGALFFSRIVAATFWNIKYGNDATGSSNTMYKTRGTTPNSYTIVQSSDVLGSLRFAGSTGSDYDVGAQINGYVAGTPGVDDMPGGLQFQTSADGTDTPLTRWSINASGTLLQNNVSGGNIAFNVSGTGIDGSGSGGSTLFRHGVSGLNLQNSTSNTTWSLADTGELTSNASNGGGITFARSGRTIAIDSGTAASACKGTGTFNGTTAVTVTTTCAATAQAVIITPTSDPTGSTAAYCWTTNISNGVSFDVDCDQANDGTFSWVIIKEG